MALLLHLCNLHYADWNKMYITLTRKHKQLVFLFISYKLLFTYAILLESGEYLMSSNSKCTYATFSVSES